MKKLDISMTAGHGFGNGILLPTVGGTRGGVRLEQAVRPWSGDVVSDAPARQRDRGFGAVASTTPQGLPTSAPPILT